MQNQMTVLPIPVPPALILEKAVGYQNDRHARFLALWWEPCGDEGMVSDGFVTFTGHWPGYLAFVQHPRVVSHLAGYDLGSSETPASHRLLIDLQERIAYIATGEEVERFLANQWAHEQSPQATTLFVEDLDSLLKEWAESKQDIPTMEEVMRRMEEDQKAVETLHTWLEEQQK
jgi:hypothetical protein